MTDWAYLLKTTISLLAIVNPIGIIPIFISATDGWRKQDRAKTARTVSVTVFIVLTISAFIGDTVLKIFWYQHPVFSGGGRYFTDANSD